jgi:hypothetical protein
MEFTPTPISGKRFENQAIRIDGYRFESCEFINCTIIWSGGPADCSACRFHPGTAWQFEGQAQTLMVVLQKFGFQLTFGNGQPVEPISFPSDAM